MSTNSDVLQSFLEVGVPRNDFKTLLQIVSAEVRERIQQHDEEVARFDGLIGDAPELLNSLSEISDALGDDPAFITNMQAANADLQAGIDSLIANLETVRAALQADVDQNESDTDAAITAEAARVDALIASGMWLYPDQASFPAAADNHGRVVHSHADASMFYAHGGMWHKIENEAEAEAARLVIQNDVDQNEADADAAEAALGVRIDSVEAEIDTARTNIYTALGETESSIAMGTFTGSTLGDGQTIKQLLQTLESATEGEISDRQAAIADILNGATFTGDILFGDLARLQESGNEFKIRNDAQSSSIVLGPKISLQPATGSRIELHETVRMPDGTDLSVTGAELNFVDGVTSNIQTQLDNIQADVDQNEADSDAAITVERGRIDAILDSADADKDSFAEIVSLINSVDTTNDDAFAAYVLSNDAAVAAVQADVDQNETDSDSADSALSARLDVLEADPTTATAVAAVQSDVDQNEADGDAADAALSGRLDVLEADPTTATALAAVQADVDQNESDADAAIAAEASTRGSADTALSGRLDVLEADPTTAAAVAAGDAATLSSANSYTDTAVSNVIGSAPGVLDTLGEIADAINDDANVYTTLVSQISAVQADVDGNETDGDAADALLSGRLDTLEVDPTTATAVQAVQDNLDTEAGTRAAADTALDGRLDVLEADPTTATAVAAVQSDVDQNEADADAAIAAEASTRGSADTALSGRLDVLEADPTTATAVAAVQADVDQNETDADAADAALSGRLDVLETDPTTATAVAAVQADVDQNESDADAALALKAPLADPNFTGQLDVDTNARVEFADNLTKIHNVLRGTSIHIGNNIELRPAAAGGRVEITGDLIIDASDFVNAPNDGDAANQGVVVGQVYRNGSDLKVRVS